MPPICFITSCKGRLDDLRRSLPRLAAQPGCSCVVVDYSCPEGAGDWVEANYPSVRVVRAPGRPEFDRSAARNLGAAAADAPWLGFVDADVLVAPDFAATLLPALEPGTFHRTDSFSEGLEGTFLCPRDAFERIGGFDEHFRGYGDEDCDILEALRFAGLAGRSFPTSLLEHIPHDDSRRVQFHADRDRTRTHAVNRVYFLLKWDLARLQRESPAPELRAALAARAAEIVGAAFSRGATAEVQVQVPGGFVPGGWLLSRTLVCRLAPGP